MGAHVAETVAAAKTLLAVPEAARGHTPHAHLVGTVLDQSGDS